MRRLSTLYVCASGLCLTLTLSACSKDPQKAQQEYLASGDKFVAAGDYPSAIIQYRNAVAIDPRQGATRLKLGRSYAFTNDSVNALREYIRAADLLPDDVEAQVAAGTGLLAAGQFEDAKARALAALAKEPKNVTALLLLGNSLAGLKDIEGAIAQVEEAIDADPQRVLAYSNLGQLELARGDRSAAEAAFKEAVQVDPKSLPARLALGNFYWAANIPVEAEREFKAALELNPKSADANRALAVFYSQSGRAAASEPYLRAWADASKDAGPKLVLADFLIANRRIPDATAVLQPLLEAPDGFGPAQRRLASLDFAAGRRAEAHKALDAILAKMPNDEDTHLQKARFLLVERDHAGALAEADAVIKINAKSAPGHFTRGIVLKGQGDVDGAAASFREVVKLRPGTVPALIQLADISQANGDAGAALEFSGEALKRQPGNGMAHLLRARALLQTRNIPPLDIEMQGLLKAAPGDPDVQILAGQYYSLKRDPARSRAAFEKALAARPGSVPALTGVIAADVADRNPAAARARIEAHLAKAPDDGALRVLAGKTYLTLDDPARAEENFRKAIQVNPDDIEGYRALATFYVRQRRLDDAKKEYEELSRRSPKQAVAATTMVAMILQAQGKSDEARTQYERVIALDPNAPVAANNLAWDYVQTGRDLNAALKLAQTAKSKLPDNADVNDTLGWVYYKKDLASLAIPPLEAAVKQAPTSPGPRYRLGAAYAKNGNTEKARTALQAAITMAPGSPEAADAKAQLDALKN